MPGSITLYIGPTKAGKTTELLRLYYCHLTKEDDIAIVLHSSVANESFTKDTMKVIQTSRLEDIVTCTLFQKSNVILIDNLQLFADSFILNILANKMDKKFICAALDNDYQRTPFDNIIDIMPKCEYVYKLTALCSQLKDTTPAIFSMKSGDKYLPVLDKLLENQDYVPKLYGSLKGLDHRLLNVHKPELFRNMRLNLKLAIELL